MANNITTDYATTTSDLSPVQFTNLVDLELLIEEWSANDENFDSDEGLLHRLLQQIHTVAALTVL